jgi:ubiquinone/menaquinone biosynthesis C-methylase UbiE
MLKHAEKNCAAYGNVQFRQANILSLDFPDSSFDKVVAGNVIHLLDEPMKALNELDRVCKPGGMLIIPTYMNKDQKGETSGFASVVGKAGADFKRQFTVESYQQFFLDSGYEDVKISLAEGRIPCAVAVMTKEA